MTIPLADSIEQAIREEISRSGNADSGRISLWLTPKQARAIVNALRLMEGPGGEAEIMRLENDKIRQAQDETRQRLRAAMRGGA